MTDLPEDTDATRQVQVLKPGTAIGRYDLVRRLGAGGMGEVYLARDTLLRRQVALKFLMPNLAANESFKERFLREARAAAALSHPNVVTIYEVGEAAGYSFIAMEFIEGTPLSEMMNSADLSSEQICGIVLQICRGLAAAHAAGLVHRDIKPANIILGNDNRIRILDFGLAKTGSDQQITQQGVAVGTVQYMSPEQAQSRKLDHRSDLFSLGIVIYELLAGQSPFKKDKPLSTMYAIINDAAPPLRGESTNTDFWQPIINKLLCKSASDRYGSAQEVIEVISSQFAGSHSGTSISVFAEPRTRALAVLYLRNAGSPEDEFISYGITEDLIVDLSRIGSFRVAPMRSILRFKDSKQELHEIAEQLDVSMILDGSIMRSGDLVRVSANLVDVQSNNSLWAERWEERFQTLPKIKTALAEGVSGALQVTNSQMEVLGVGAPSAHDHTAYEQYLRAKYLFEHKQDSSDVDVALGLYQQALRREGGLLAARAGLAEILSYQGHHSQALEKLQESLNEAEGRGLKPEQAAINRLIAETYKKMAKWNEAWEFATRAAKLYESLSDLAGECEAISTMISILQPQSRYDEALDLFDRVLAISRQQEDSEKTAEALKTMGVIYARRGEYNNALSLYEEALEMAASKQNLDLQAACLSNIGNIEFFRRNHEEAADFYRRSRQLYDKIGDSAGSMRQLLNEGTIHYIKADYIKASDCFKEAIAEFEREGNRSSLSLALMNLSQTNLQQGLIVEAEQAAKRALDIGIEIGRPLVECDGYLRLGDIAVFKGDSQSAEAWYNKAYEIATEHNFTRNLAYILLGMADLFYNAGDLQRCDQYAADSKRAAREVDEKSIMLIASAYSAAVDCRKGRLNSSLHEMRRVVKEMEAQPDRSLEVRAKSLLGEALVECGTNDTEKREGKQLLSAMLQLAERLSLKLEIKRLKPEAGAS